MAPPLGGNNQFLTLEEKWVVSPSILTVKTLGYRLSDEPQ